MAWRYLRVRPRRSEPWSRSAAPTVTEGNALTAGAPRRERPELASARRSRRSSESASGKGTWSPATPSWSRVIEGAARVLPRGCGSTPSRPYADVVLVAMDMRQLSSGCRRASRTRCRWSGRGATGASRAGPR
ncbi:MAG: hypothetical protein R3A52_19720 [Polyangiales bacterium]